MRFLRSFFRDPEPARPVLLRVRAPRGAPAKVEVQARWAPSGRVQTRQVATDAGLCILPWMTDASAVDLRLRADGARARLLLALSDTEGGEVVEVELDERPSIPAGA